MPSQLETVATGLSAGQWGLLNSIGSNGYTSTLLIGDVANGTPVGSVFAFSDRLVYDPIKDRFRHVGVPHYSTGIGRPQLTQYDVATNTWSHVYLSSSFGLGHTYTSNAANINTRQHFFSWQLVQNTIRMLDLDTNYVTNDAIASPAQSGVNGDGEPAQDFFPERNEFLRLQGNALARYKYPKDAWENVPNSGSHIADGGTGTTDGIGFRWPTLIYSAKHKCVVMMGGTNTDASPAVQKRKVVRYNADGTFTVLTSVPVGLWIYGTHSVCSVDPVSGNILVLGGVQAGDLNTWTGAAQFWELNPSGPGTWTNLGTANLPALSTWWNTPPGGGGDNVTGTFGMICVPVNRYGVVLFANYGSFNHGKVYVYKHTASSAPNYTFAEKINSQAGILGAYDFDSAADVRAYPVAAAYPLKYGGWGGTGPCASAGLGTEYDITPGRNAGTPAGSLELTALVHVQNGVCYFPTIDTDIKKSGSGSLRIEVPARSNQGNGGYFDTTFQGVDRPHVRVGPDTNGGSIWHQFQYRTSNMQANDFSNVHATSQTKLIIFGHVPPGDGSHLGTDLNLASVFQFQDGYNVGGTSKNGIWSSYTRNAAGDFALTERNIGGITYLETGVLCPAAGHGPYSFPPCVKLADNIWHEITRHFRLRPVASDFVVSGTTLTRPGTFSPGMVLRQVYIADAGYFTISGVIDADNVTLSGSPGNGSNRTVYISNSSNSIMREWVDGVLVMDISDQQMLWDVGTPGWGQFRLQPHQTGRDDTQNANGGAGTVWYDDFLVSTEPIPFGSTAASQPGPPPPGPSSSTLMPILSTM